jgi:hypothetical protein
VVDWLRASQELTGKVPWQANTILSMVPELNEKLQRKLPDLDDPLAGQKLYRLLRYPLDVCESAVEQIKAALAAQVEQERPAAAAPTVALPKVRKTPPRAAAPQPRPPPPPKQSVVPPAPAPALIERKPVIAPQAYDPALAELDLVAEDMLCSMSDSELEQQALRLGVAHGDLTRGELVEQLLKALET